MGVDGHIALPIDMPASGLYFGVYEWLLRVMTPQGQRYTQELVQDGSNVLCVCVCG